MPATIADVARRAGVGRGTVSRVLNERPNVDASTRARVLAAIAELAYVPSPTARRLSLGRTQTIGVVVPHMTTASVVERLRGIEAALVPAGFDLIVFNVESIERRDRVFREVPHRARVDGLLVVSIEPRTDEVERARAAGVPMVLVDVDHDDVPSVIVDDVAGGRLAAEHLIALGHRRIAFVGDQPKLEIGFRSSRLRLEGVRAALADAGLDLPPGRVAIGGHDRASAAELARGLLEAPDAPTAIACSSDTQALGTIEAIRARGLEVPGDVSVIGYDDVELSAVVGLTTIRQPLELSGRRGVERLLAAIGGQAEPEQADRATGHEGSEVLPVELVVRATTGPPPAHGRSAR